MALHRFSVPQLWRVAERQTEISQLRSGWWQCAVWIRAEGTMDGANAPSSFQDENLLGAFPDTSCLANFRLSLSGRSFAEAGAQILVQPGEGAFKGVAVLPVREIGEVIFADFFRQIFALAQVQWDFCDLTYGH